MWCRRKARRCAISNHVALRFQAAGAAYVHGKKRIIGANGSRVPARWHANNRFPRLRIPLILGPSAFPASLAATPNDKPSAGGPVPDSLCFFQSVELAVIEAIGLRKSYGVRTVLDGIFLSVARGEVVGLLGPNGAGKTTTLSILATLLDADAGEVRIDGRNTRADPRAARSQLGFVPQSIAVYPPLSPAQNVELFARVHRIPFSLARRRAAETLATVGLTARAGDPVWTLSGGMKRRLNLACGLVHGPKALLLDEPTVGVDPESREDIMVAIRRFAAEGAAVLYSTHYMEEVERLCDRAYLIDSGRVIAEGTIADLIELGGRRPRMEINFERMPADRWYAAVDGVTVSGGGADPILTLQLAGLGQVTELLDRAREAGGRIREFAVHSPNLSDAFMALTGHALRDADAN
jgi:ABC-2 type transport system ATP-binding protein